MTPDESKNDFLLLTAHELRTSLTAHKWLFAMMLHGEIGPLSVEQKTMLTQALVANERMITLTADILTVLRDTAPNTLFHIAPLDIDQLLEDAVLQFSSQAKQYGVTLQYTATPTPIIIEADNVNLRIVLHNIIDNAIKYSTTGTTIVCTTTLCDGCVSISISNIGVGISTDVLPHLFEKFYRKTPTKTSGMGVGLYVSKHIIEEHHGTIAVVSTPEHDTTFTITLPITFPKK